MTRAFAINEPHVVHETIDGETILIHLGTGTYYSLDGVAGETWALLIAGTPEDRVASLLESRYEAEPGLVATSVSSLAEELLAEGLLVPAPAGGEEPVTAGAEEPVTAGAEEPVGVAQSQLAAPAPGASFAAPVLNKYTDMQEFMLVDPIHDVDAEAGWPHVKPA